MTMTGRKLNLYLDEQGQLVITQEEREDLRALDESRNFTLDAPLNELVTARVEMIVSHVDAVIPREQVKTESGPVGTPPPVRELWPEQIAEELFRLPDPVTGELSPYLLSSLPVYREVATILCRMAVERMCPRAVRDCQTCRHDPKDGGDFHTEPCRTCNPTRMARGPYLSWAQKD